MSACICTSFIFSFRLKKIEAESLTHEVKANELLQSLQQTERELNQKEMKYLRDQKDLQQKLADAEETIRHTEEHCDSLTRELQTKQACISSLQEELSQATENLAKECAGNQQLYNRLQNLEDRSFSKSKIHISSLTDLTNINLDVDLDTLNQDELLEHCLDLRGRFEKAVLEIRAIKRELRQSYAKYDALELKNLSLQRDLESVKYEAQTEHAQMVARIDHLTSKLASAEKQIRSKSKERRSLSLKGKKLHIHTNSSIEVLNKWLSKSFVNHVYIKINSFFLIFSEETLFLFQALTKNEPVVSVELLL